MNPLSPNRATPWMGSAFLLLAGCWGQPQVVGPEPMTQDLSGRLFVAEPGIRPGARDGALIYAVGGCGGTCVLSYPQGALVGKLATDGAAICSDDQGNVFIANDSTVTQYAHGETTPSSSLNLPGGEASGCGVDPTTNNLAVVFKGSGVDVAVFPDEKGTPTTYATHLESLHCGYDDAGNLFTDGYDGKNYGFAELPSGATQFAKLSIDQSVGVPGQVQWDGRYITYEGTGRHEDTIVSRLSISISEATVVGSSSFNIKHRAYASWISGRAVIIPYIVHGRVRGNGIGVWHYPEGGNPKRKIDRFGSYKKKTLDFQGVTLSVQS